MFSSSTGLFSILPLPELHRSGWCRVRHSDERRVLYTGCTAGHTGKILPAWSDGRRCRILQRFYLRTAERFQRFGDTNQVSRVMQRCERGGIFDALNDGLINDYGAGILLAAVYDTVTNCS